MKNIKFECFKKKSLVTLCRFYFTNIFIKNILNRKLFQVFLRATFDCYLDEKVFKIPILKLKRIPSLKMEKFKENLIIFKGDDTLEIWNIQTEKCITKINKMPYDDITSFTKLNNNEVIIGSFYGKIHIWNVTIKNENINWNNCKGNWKTFYGHTSAVTCLIRLSNTKFASAGYGLEGKIIVLDKTVSSLITLKHYGFIHCLLKLNENEIVSGSIDKTIKLWNIKLRVCLKTVLIDYRIKAILKLNEEQIACSFRKNNSIKIFDLLIGKPIKTFSMYKGKVKCLIKLNLKQMLSAEDFTVKIWDFINGNCLKTLLFDKYCSICWILKLNEKQCMSNNKDLTIKIWNV